MGGEIQLENDQKKLELFILSFLSPIPARNKEVVNYYSEGEELKYTISRTGTFVCTAIPTFYWRYHFYWYPSKMICLLEEKYCIHLFSGVHLYKFKTIIKI